LSSASSGGAGLPPAGRRWSIFAQRALAIDHNRCSREAMMTTERVRTIVMKYGDSRGGLISTLDELQAKAGYLSETDLRAVAALTGRELVDIYGVATFYKAFRLEPRGLHLASVCVGTACHVRGAPAVLREFEQQLGLAHGAGDTAPGTTDDGAFTLQPVRCVGACALGPIVVMDGDYYSAVGPGRVAGLIAERRSGAHACRARDERVCPLEVSCPRCLHTLMDHDRLIDGHPSVRFTVSFGQEHGWLRLSCLYGSYTVEAGGEIPADTVVNFFCPHCHGELIGAWNCEACGAPMVPLMVLGGGIVQLCSRRGCRSHMLDLQGDAS
jgi:NADH:ubiquinone oxidoreductase subunit E